MPIKYFYKDGIIPEAERNITNYRELKQAHFSPDFAFAQYLIEEFGVAALPLSPFYNNTGVTNPLERRGINYLRFAVCKNDETYDTVAKAFAPN